MSSALEALIQGLGNSPLTSYKGNAYRMHNPVWAWSPLSMEGATITGGRFNPKGFPALYLGLSVNGCWAEVSGGATNAVLAPQMLCSYAIEIDGVVDLRSNYRDLFAAPWRAMLLGNREPPGWALCRAISAHPQINGILVPSYVMTSESNLVLYRLPPKSVKLFDPEGRLTTLYGGQLDLDI
ncbi:RES domain-containing protein [Maribrevibacterium harenarium]|uniref:RES domain-containing protein n=1 Tax=Maribrevibacterium harenarium TaxID=2589817 RepID=A0A501X073_9GAMM|nr:RES family NAD+ phosphorylase [Maribrevibacterium harenarium]TPE54314.1 RES domain-containing protein [Maribrevibacterium harenarium]